MSGSDSSESESFYDAEDTEQTLVNVTRESTKKLKSKPAPTETKEVGHTPDPADPEPGSHVSPVVESQIEILTGDQLSSRDQRWSRLERLRRRDEDRECSEEGRGNREEEEPDSTESSVEGIYVSGVRSLHPFKVVESDARSIQSDTRSAARSSVSLENDIRARLCFEENLLQGSSPSRDHETSRESMPPPLLPPQAKQKMVELLTPKKDEPAVPDIVSSSKPVTPAQPTAPPVTTAQPTAPPRRKKRSDAPCLSRELSVEPPVVRPTSLTAIPSIQVESPALPSPNTTVNYITRGLEQSLIFSSPDGDGWDEPDAETGPVKAKDDSPHVPPVSRPVAGRQQPNFRDLDAVSGLNIHLACRGDFVVKPQDDEKSKGIQGEEKERLFKESVEYSAEISMSKTFSQDPSGAQGSTEQRVKCKSPPAERSNSVRSRGHKHSSSLGQRPSTDGHHSGSSGGYHSGGSGGQHSSGRPTSARGSGGSDRRSVAGSVGSGGSDGGIIKQLGMYVRTKSDSGKRLTDQEILQQIKVKNLDTGNEMDLATAEEQLPQSINPLSLHIMRLTSEYTGTRSTSATTEATSFDSDTESVISSVSDFEIGQGKSKKNKTLNKLLGGVAKVSKSASKAAKIISEEVSKRQRTKEEKEEEKLGRLATDISTTDGVSRKDGDIAAAQGFKRIQAHKSGPWDFENIQFGQDLSGHHSGPIWCMKFSLCGRLLATAGQDCILRIWVLRDKHGIFSEMRRRYQVEHEGITEEQVTQDEITEGYLNNPDSRGHIFMDRPFVTYTGHTSDLLDISWSNNFFILTSSMDKTVRLWHISRKECLCVFQHIDFVTAIGFHPKNDKFFISGSLDGKIRLWNIPDKKVALWNEVDGPTKLITAANFCQNGKFAVVGTYDGRCIFYSTDQLKYHTTIHVRSARGKNSRGRKVTGIEPMPGEDKILVTSTDSRIRLYDLRDLNLICKYRGYTNLSSQIRACFSPDGRYICAGSENQCVFLWSSVHVPSSLTARKDRNNYYEAIKAHSAAVTVTLFAPVPELVFEAVERGREAAGVPREGDPVGEKEVVSGYVVISGDYDGDIKVFIKEGKKQTSLPRH